MRWPVLVCMAGLLGCQSSSEPSFASRESLEAMPEETFAAEPSTGERPPEEAATEEPERLPLGPTQADEPPRMHEEDNSAVIEFSPADLATSTEGTFPTVLVPFRGLGEEDSRRLADQLRLVTWPERVAVPTTAHYIDDAMEGGPTHARILLEPRESLVDRWYAIEARLDRDGGEPRLRTRSRQDAYIITPTHAYARFRLGAQPVVQRVDVTAAIDGRAWVTVQFSERMRLEGETPPVAITADGRPVVCSLSAPEDVREESGSLELALACAGILPRAHVAVRFSSSLPVSVRTTMESDTLRHERGESLLGVDGGDGSREVFELDIPATAEARFVSPSAPDELRVPRWYTATARSMFGLEPHELTRHID